jgi:hypothetical protein
MIGGGIAAIAYGEPRLTIDVDIVVFLRESDIQRIAAVFPESDFYAPPQEIIADEAKRGGQFNIIHMSTGFKADFYPSILMDDLNEWGFRFRREIQFEGEPVVLAPPEYVIVRKLEYFRQGGSEKHLRDIRSMLAVSEQQIDKTRIREWIQRLGLELEWRKVST